MEPDTIAEAETGASTVTVGTGGKIFAADQAVALLFAGTADETDDYTVADANDRALTAPYELTLAAGETSVTVIVTAVDDEDVDAGETIEITAMHDGAAIGAAQTIAIADDDEAVSVPDPPAGLEATASGTGTIELSWTAPAADGGAAITGYRIEWSADGSTGWADLVADTGSTATSAADTMLGAGTTRHYRVSAINSEGTGDPSNVASATTDVPVTVTAASSVHRLARTPA